MIESKKFNSYNDICNHIKDVYKTKVLKRKLYNLRDELNKINSRVICTKLVMDELHVFLSDAKEIAQFLTNNFRNVT